ncbi:hypothetical protein TRVL_09465 [Trypanosoma vivax]|uniref:Uncharacterized protein n=1 Tax=Trypanosoma vivax (strain Y486) TaxID=1055687 RepID=G0TS32_TRYVY|nr:hypothetical protein TRVL_09465 [Trypanosoma vivax]CCC46756.1 hypothetical protein, unlikely [Trypanosoma vivax Y486]
MKNAASAQESKRNARTEQATWGHRNPLLKGGCLSNEPRCNFHWARLRGRKTGHAIPNFRRKVGSPFRHPKMHEQTRPYAYRIPSPYSEKIGQREGPVALEDGKGLRALFWRGGAGPKRSPATRKGYSRRESKQISINIFMRPSFLALQCGRGGQKRHPASRHFAPIFEVARGSAERVRALHEGTPQRRGIAL